MQEARPAIVRGGAILDTRLCAPLTNDEQATLQNLISAERRRLSPQMQEARSTWSGEYVKRLVARGVSEGETRAQVDRWVDQQELTGAFPLVFDDRKLNGATVADVLANPERFVNQTLADPHEGPAYGRVKAMVLRRRDGSLFINSFAHGGMTYELVSV
jgi:hypothetical protein